jgi:L-amino acid N-acyltransferase YncA
MMIRTYQPGDEQAQAEIYNAATGSLPGFKPSTAEEILRRYQGAGADPTSRFYATENGQIVGYAIFSPNGRISFPWCRAGAEACREPLLESVLTELQSRGYREAWAAYRGDWSLVLDIFRQHGFVEKRTMINYVAAVSDLLATVPIATGRQIEPLQQADLPHVLALGPRLFAGLQAQELAQFLWHNAFYRFPESLFVLKDLDHDKVLGAFLLVVDDRFADPTKIDPAMPCFRLGAFGTESERHKRVNGLYSCIFADDADTMLAHALAYLAAGTALTHIAAQVPSDSVSLCRWYDRWFKRQGSFPIFSRPLAS